jgi:hypothetical protein
MVANERAVTKREVPGGSERLGRGGDPLAPNSGEGFSFCRARILKTPQIPSLSSSRAAADETSSSGSVPAHA